MTNDRKIRHRRIRAKIYGTQDRPRLSVYRSGKHLEAQLIDDQARKTIVGLKDLKVKKGTKAERAANLGEVLGKEILNKGYKKIVFDRGGYQYHGRIKAFAESLRKSGLEF
jgi:large subunit ribosomal protein L18